MTIDLSPHRAMFEAGARLMREEIVAWLEARCQFILAQDVNEMPLPPYMTALLRRAA